MSTTYSVSIDPDSEGYLGRECPACEKYFKVVPGTGIDGEGEIPCVCPYCGTSAPSDHFWTKAQLEYAESVAFSQVVGELDKMLKRLERKPDPKAFISIGIKVEGKPVPIVYYRELDLEQRLTCDNCTLQYAIYGVFGFCPDCGVHNSQQILVNNLSLTDQLLALAENTEPEIGRKLAESALADSIAAFDGFGREIAAVHSGPASKPKQAASISFQNLKRASEQVEELFGIDLSAPLDLTQWEHVNRCFQKRHVFAHKMGVADQHYVDRSGDDPSLVGRRLSVSPDEIRQLNASLSEIATRFASSLKPSAT